MTKNKLLPYTLLLFGWMLTWHACANVPSASDSTQQEILTIHNQLRALHHAPPLLWDNTLQRYAEQHANQCVFKHSGSPYGENLAAGHPSIQAAILAWYAEQAQYSYHHPRYSPQTGHFTQLIWASTQKLGCAYVACNGKNATPGKYLVCEYSPAGNVINPGFFEQNVLPG